MKTLMKSLLVAGAVVAAPSAHAVDGCKVLLCLAGPWRTIADCVPPVEQLFRDLALGHSFPTCTFQGPGGSESDSSDSGTSAVNTNMSLDTCPPMYDVCDTKHHTVIGCRFQGVISIRINDGPWSDTYWSQTADTSTHYYSPYIAQMPADTVDPTWDNDLAAYNRTHRGQDNPCGGVGN